MPPLETFTICDPQPSSLTIINAYYFPKVLNVVAPQLKNLTASIQSSLQIQHGDYLQLSAVRSDSLEKVPQERVQQWVHNEPTNIKQWVHNEPTIKRNKLDAENKQPETIDEERKMLEAEMQRRNEVIAEQKAIIQRQDGVIAELKTKIEILEAAKV
ncbi:hypothetical protein Tco_0206754 [Tanacetum coccineum]